ncbi:MAG TPA: response regulator [Terracidiphilus sp.]|jgi:CheY-like chemotaxis protein|nr:response regulator [Terracidiphilus sp.]
MPRPDNPLRVLVVDDESMIADSLVRIFNGQGFESLAAYNGHAAVAIAVEFAPHVLITDVVMPGMNGFELAIRFSQLLPQCRVILFSGQAETVDLREKAGVEPRRFDIYTKPVSPQIFINRLQMEQNLLQ